ncbi:MAG TPA: histidine kinase dimerization/phospho-acceptor domain-containing protein, partial [Anaerolineae bacterium]|nr:histidine kinase dimerization/phospho-acceptor domain-containing protein [Anaerolineae bacterium]
MKTSKVWQTWVMERLATDTTALANDALHSLADGLTLVDDAGRIAFLNPRAEALFGIKADAWIGVPVANLYRAIARNSVSGESLTARFEQSAEQAEQLPTLEFTLRLPQERMVEAKWFALRGASSHGAAYGVLWRDATREKELDQMKTQLLSTVSHELRTPLASIKGFATTLLRQDVRWDEATQREFLRIIEEESNRLEELIDDLLDMSQLEEGALRIQKEPVQLRHVVREAVEAGQRSTETHWFVMDLPAELPRVWADPRRIRQVLNNLLENAIKYSPNGGQITVTCEVEGGFVVVSVADQGQGIPKEYLDRVFD